MKPTEATSKQIEIPYLLKIGKGKIARVGKYLYDKGLTRVALFWGEGVEDIVGRPFMEGLAHWGVQPLHSQTVSTVEIDAITHGAFSLPPVTAIVGIGGGRALDFAKYCAHVIKVPFISIPTAISHDGFSSPSASLTVAGKRKSVKAGSPFGVVIDLEIIKNSPDVFLYSGVGDMVSKTTALWDWRAARERGQGRYVDFSALLAYNSLDILFLKHAFNIRGENFQRSLASSLTMSGLAMEIAGSSRPASGSEHLISHALDALSPQPKMHGIQVGVATCLCALLQNNRHSRDIKFVFEQTGFLAYMKENPLDYNEFIEALRLAPTIKHDFYTILSEEDSFERAVEYIHTDDCLNIMIKESFNT